MRNKTLSRRAGLALGVLLTSLTVGLAHAEDIIRTPLPDGNPFPISAAVTVRGDLDTVYLSGALPAVLDKNAAKGSVAAYGNTEAQTVSALDAIKSSLARLGLDMGNVVKMTVFLVADPSMDNKLDFMGMMAAYSKYFGTKEQPNKPARSTVQVAALVAPGALVEIEVVAVKPR